MLSNRSLFYLYYIHQTFNAEQVICFYYVPYNINMNKCRSSIVQYFIKMYYLFFETHKKSYSFSRANLLRRLGPPSKNKIRAILARLIVKIFVKASIKKHIRGEYLGYYITRVSPSLYYHHQICERI